LNRLNPDLILEDQRAPWQPDDLVAVIGKVGNWAAYSLHCIACSPDGRWVLSGETCIRHVLDPDGKLVSHGARHYISVREAASLRPVATLEVSAEVVSLVFTPDGKTLVSAADDNTVQIWEFDGPQASLRFEIREPSVIQSRLRLRVSPDGRFLLVFVPPTKNFNQGRMTFFEPSYFRLWELKAIFPSVAWAWAGPHTSVADCSFTAWLALAPQQTPRECFAFQQRNENTDATLTADGRGLITVGSDGVQLWDLAALAAALGAGHAGWEKRTGEPWHEFEDFSPGLVVILLIIVSFLMLISPVLLIILCIMVRRWLSKPVAGPISNPAEGKVVRAKRKWIRYLIGAAVCLILVSLGVLLYGVVFKGEGPAPSRPSMAPKPLDPAPSRPSTIPKPLDPAPLVQFSNLPVNGSVALAPNRGLLAVSQSDGSILLLQVDSSGMKWMARIIVSAVGQAGGLRHPWQIGWTAKTMMNAKLLTRLAGHPGVDPAKGIDLAFAPDGKRLASAASDGTVRLWDVSDQPRAQAVLPAPWMEFPNQAQIAFTPDSRSLVAGQENGNLRLLDVSGNEPRQKVPPPNREKNAFLLAGGEWIAEAHTEKSTLCLWDMTGAMPVQKAQLRGYDQALQDVSVSPDGRWLASLESPWDEKEVQAAILAEGQFYRDRKPIRPLPEQKNILRLWDLSGPEPLERLSKLAPGRMRLISAHTPERLMAFTPDSRMLVEGSGDGVVRLWDLGADSPVLRAALPKPKIPGCIRSLTLSPDGRSVLVARGGLVEGGWQEKGVWDLSHATPSWDVLPDSEGPLPQAFRDNNETALDAKEVKEFLVGKRSKDQSPNPHQSIQVPIRTSKGMRLWEWLPPGEVRNVEVAPDRRHILTFNSDGSIYVIRPDPSGAFSRLLRSCEEVLKRDPRCVEALVTRGRIRLANEQIDEALSDASAAEKIVPGHAEAVRLRAAALHRLGLKQADEGKYAESKANLAKAIELDPTLAPPARPGKPPR